MTTENKSEKNITIDGSKIYAHIPKYFIAIVLTMMFAFPERFATLFHGTPSTSLSAGKIENGNFSDKRLVSFWTPSPCDNSNSKCTHQKLKEAYNNQCKKDPLKSRLNCKKLKKRIQNGYYFIKQDHIESLGNTLMRAKANGFNYFPSKGASRGSPIKPGLWWEVTFSKNSDIDQDKLKKIVNDAFSRDKKPSEDQEKKCTYNIGDEEKEKEALDCWSTDKTREPIISVYAEIRG